MAKKASSPGKKSKNGSFPALNLKEQKKLVVEIGRRIWHRGMCAGNEGNHSVRLDEKRVLCTPSQISKGFMKEEDLAVCDLDGNQLSGKKKRTSEMLLHLAIYKNRPDVRAVVHGHPPHATAFCVSGVPLPACVHPEAEVFLGQVKTVPYVTPGDERLGNSVIDFVKDRGVNTLLLGQHGVVTFAEDLERAYFYFEVIESYAKILLLTKQIGQVKVFDGQQMKELLALKKRFGLDDVRMDETFSDWSRGDAFLRGMKG